QQHQTIIIINSFTDNHLVHSSRRRESGQILTPVHCIRGPSSTLGAGVVYSSTVEMLNVSYKIMYGRCFGI
ncbi:hypothetical protein HN873_048726, partial [Arachis hypogaea]